MTDHRIIVPSFIDRPVPGIAELARSDDSVIAIPFAPGKQIERVLPGYRALAALVEQTLRAGARPVAMMGDCCLTIPILAGIRRAGIEPTLIWLDAHGDFNTWETTPSGFLGGMPLAMMVGRGELTMCEAVGLERFPEERVTLADGRDLDHGERTALSVSRVRHVKGLAELQRMNLPDGPIYVHFDTDIISADDAPAFHYPVKNGPSAVEVRDVLSWIGRDGDVVATSMTCWAPELDTDGGTKAKCLAAYEALLSS